MRNSLIEKFNIFVDKRVKSLKTFWFTPVGRIIILFGIFIIATVPLTLMVLGFDNYIIRSTVSGTIYSIDNEVVPDAEIIIQGKTVRSDHNGYFYLDNLDYGKWEVVIKANGYNEYREMITLDRFGNAVDFEIIPLDFGVLKGALVVENLITDSISLSINEQNIEVGEAGAFESERLIVGKYSLKFTSPFYKDFEQDVEIKSGIHRISPIELIPTGDLKFSVIDSLTGAKLDGYEVNIEGTSSDKLSENEGNYELNDIVVGVEITISIEKDDYEDKAVKFTTQQGINDLGEITLIKQGIVYYEQYGNVYSSKYSGEDPTILSEGLAGCEFIGSDNNYAYLGCFTGIYKSDSKTGQHTKIYDQYNNLDGYIDDFGLVKIENGSLSFVTEFDVVEAFSSDTENIISWVYGGSQSIYLSTNAAVYKLNLSDYSAQEVTTGEFYLQDVNMENNELVALNYTTADKTESKIWIIKDSGEKSSVTVFADRYKKVKLLGSGNVAVLIEVDGKQGLYKQNLNGSNRELLLDGAIFSMSLLNENSEIYISGSNIYLLSTSGNLTVIKEG